ncbi:MAG: AAA family ATPase, partial [Catenulispora sp.]|nr:AAA family ATPase [Catenulispora sp.]
MFGRDPEVGALAAYVQGVVAGEGGAVVVVGDAGIGKSALLEQVRQNARARGCLVLTTTGVEPETELPFAALHQLLRPVLPEVSVLPDVQRDALLSAFGLCEGQRPDPALICIAVVNLLTILGRRRPLVVVADDVQWFDPQSHETFAVLARRAGEGRVAVFAAMRSGHAGALLSGGITRLFVEGVDEEAAGAILHAYAPGLSAADGQRVLADARGNPLALLELPATVEGRAWPGPDGTPPSLTVRLERAFAGRLAELAAPSRDVVLVAACASVDRVDEIFAAAAVLGGTPVDEKVLEPAVAAGLMFTDGLRVEFRHPLVRSGVLQSEGVARRLAAHAAIAEVAGDAYRKVWHRAQSLTGRDDETADALEANVEVALGRGAVMSAIQALERAAQLTSRPDRRGRRLLMAAEHAFGLGNQELVARLTDAAGRLELSELDTARLEWLREIFNDGTPGDAVRVQQLCDIAHRAASA